MFISFIDMIISSIIFDKNRSTYLKKNEQKSIISDSRSKMSRYLCGHWSADHCHISTLHHVWHATCNDAMIECRSANEWGARGSWERDKRAATGQLNYKSTFPAICPPWRLMTTSYSFHLASPAFSHSYSYPFRIYHSFCNLYPVLLALLIYVPFL